MNRAALHEGLRRMRFESLLDRHKGGEITQAEAAEMLGVSERTFRRWTERFEGEGEAGLHDRRLGRPSPKRAPVEEIGRMLGLFKEKYADFTAKHFHEQLRKRHNYKLGYTVTKVHLRRAGLIRPAPKRSAQRKKRPRRPFVGMLLHQDGSPHARLEEHRPLYLIATTRWARSNPRSYRDSKLGVLLKQSGEWKKGTHYFRAGRAIVLSFAETAKYQLWISYLKSYDVVIADCAKQARDL
jgi:transposase